MYFKTEGIILLQKNLGEADKLLTIYTKDHGKLTCIAKGVRRPVSKKSGHIELGNWCRIFVAKGKNIDLLTEVELIKAFGAENFTSDKANKIYHLLEIINLLTATNQKNPQVFYLLVSFLNSISRGYNFNLVSNLFKIHLLKSLGFLSSTHLEPSGIKKLLAKLEEKDYRKLDNVDNLLKVDNLKLLSFLDSMIENLTEKKLKTAKFVYAQIL